MVIGKCTDVFRGFFGWGEGLRRGGYVGGTFHLEIENLSWGKKISMKGAQDFLALLKKTMKK